MNVPKVEKYEHYFDSAFRDMSKISIDPGIPKASRARVLEKEKARAFYNYLYNSLTMLIEHFPKITNLSAFYKELLDVTIGIDKYKKSLGAINWSRFMVKKLFYSVMKQKLGLDAFIGRSKSSLKQVKSDFVFLDSARRALATFPSVKSLPTVLIAGFPNVGKTSLLAKLTKSAPEIANYPFTTKNINVGILDIKNSKIQVIDTPGLLERPFSDRNVIEKKAITALKYLANLVLFLFDSSGAGGYGVPEQQGLLEDIKELFSNKTIVTVTNKCDLDRSLKTDFYISCTTEEGINELKEFIAKQLLK
jgi:nucleolar GTP-binding protein